MTHEQMISGKWFTLRDIAAAFACDRSEAVEYCDRTTAGLAKGGYGMNILDKIHPLPAMRVAAARSLAHHAMGDSDCPACGR